MARSTYIYLLYRLYPNTDPKLIGAFTVKYEMANYVEDHPELEDKYECKRLKDGDPTYEPETFQFDFDM
jgi:hypothetical protein